jgi:hypothetical protein
MKEENSSIQQGFEPVDLISDRVSKAISSTQKILEGSLSSEKKDFESGLLENLQGAEVWLNTKVSRRSFLIGGLSLILAACSPGLIEPLMSVSGGEKSDSGTSTKTSQPTARPTEKEVPTEIATKTPEATKKPEDTKTPEIKQYKVCTPEHFRDCLISVDDLFDGKYLEWLNTLSRPFDPKKVKDVPLVNIDNVIIYDIRTLPNFTEKDLQPFRRDVTTGYVVFYDSDNNRHEYAVMPIEYYDKKNPDKNQWVITVQSFYYPGHIFTEAEELKTMRVWENYMNITPILTNNLDFFTKISDPLVAKTFAKYPDMAERFEKFTNRNKLDTNGQDMSALSAPGIVLLNTIAGSDKKPAKSYQ